LLAPHVEAVSLLVRAEESAR